MRQWVLNLVAAAVALVACATLQAQVRINPEQLAGLTPVDPAQLPQTGGKFWILGHPVPDFPRPSLRCVPPDLLELGVPIYSLGNQRYVVDARGVDWEALQEQRELKRALATLEREGAGMSLLGGGVGMPDFAYGSNDLWLQLEAFTNQTAALVINRPWDDTNVSHDLYYTTNLAPPVDWRFKMRCVYTNALVAPLCDAAGFFTLSRTNGDLTVTTNVTPEQMAQMLVPSWVTVSNATYTGALEAKGTFTGGHGCGLPIESGVILSSGPITNAIGPNNHCGGGEQGFLDTLGDADLDSLTDGGPTTNAAVLEFDMVSASNFIAFEYVFASEEYPEWIAAYNDPFGILLSTNFDGTNWLYTTNMALCAGTNVSVYSINGGCEDRALTPTRPEYYVDNDDPSWSSVSPYAISPPAFNIQYDGMTVLLASRAQISPGIRYRVKICIADFGDQSYDSAVLARGQSCPCP
jgi:hypothetical protein